MKPFLENYRFRRLRMALAASLAGILCLLSACSFSQDTAQSVPELLEPKEAQAGTVTVERRDLVSADYLDVSAVPVTTQLYLETSGVCDSVLVKVGDVVQEGDVLLTIDETDLLQQIEDLEEQISSLSSQYSYAESAAYCQISIAQNEQAQAAESFENAQKDLADAEQAKAEQEAQAAESSQTAEESSADESSVNESSAEESSVVEESSAETSSDAGGSDSSSESTSDPDSGSSSDFSSDSGSDSGSSSSSAASSSSSASSENSSETSAEASSQTSEDSSSSASDTAQDSGEEPITEETLSSLKEVVSAAEYAVTQAGFSVRKAQLNYSQMVEDHSLSLSQMQNELDSLRSKTGQNTLTAPFSGRITQVNFSVGQQISAYSVCVQISDESLLVLQGESASNDTLQNAERLEAVMNGVTYEAEYIPYEKREYTQMLLKGEEPPSRFRLAGDPDGTLSGVSFGDTGTVLVYHSYKENVLSVPRGCVSHDTYGYYVYLDQDGQRTKQYITVGISTTSWYEVRDGLSEGDVIYEDE